VTRSQLSLVVEGQSEERALPGLVARICAHLGLAEPVFRRPFRIKRQRVDRDLGRALTLCAAKMSGKGLLLVLLDSDNECAKERAPKLLALAAEAGPAIPKAVVLAVREIEAWLLAAAESLRGLQGLRDDLHPPPDPERVGSPKAWLKERMTGTRTYGPVVDLPVLVRHIDIDLARQRAPSFDKFCRTLETLLERAG